MPFDAYTISRNGVVRYVGITTRSVDLRWKYGHLQPGGKGKSAVKDAIKRFGKRAFSVEHVASAWDMKSLSDLERILIEQYDTMSPNGYNLRTGGFESLVFSEETRRKISQSKTGKKRTPEQCARISASQKGKKMSAAAIEKTRRRMTGVPMPDAVKEKLRVQRMGKKLSEEHKRKLSVSHFGKNTGPRGPYPPEHGRAISDGWRKRREKINERIGQGSLPL